MKKLFCLQAVFLLICFSGKAQFPLTAEMTGLSGQSLFTVSPEGRVFGNSCTLDSVPGFSLGLSSSRSFLLEELSEYSAAAQIRLPSAVILSGGFAMKGFSLFRYHLVQFALSKKFGRNCCVSLGGGSSGVRQGEGNGSISHPHVSAGLQVRLSPITELASGYRIPIKKSGYATATLFQLGVRFRFSPVFSLQPAVEMRGTQSAFFTALRYRPHPRLSFDLGSGGKPFRFSLGCGMEVKRLRVRLAMQYCSLPGMTPAIGVESTGN